MTFTISSLNDKQKFALFYGVMLGDGCLSYYETNENRKIYALTITGSFADDKDFYKEILFPLLKSLGRKAVTIKDRSYAGAIEINFPDKRLFDKIHSLGFPIGKKGVRIFIPYKFYKENLLKYVIAGFMATDGSLVLTKNPNKYYPRIEGNGISELLIKQIQEYFLKIGMNGSFYLAKRKNFNLPYKVHPQYRFQFNGKNNLLLFNKKIGFVNPKHQKKFEEFLSYDKAYDQKIKGVASQEQRFVRIKGFSGSRGS